MTKIAVIPAFQFTGVSSFTTLPNSPFGQEQAFEKDLNSFQELVDFIHDFRNSYLLGTGSYTLTNEHGWVVLRFSTV